MHTMTRQIQIALASLGIAYCGCPFCFAEESPAWKFSTDQPLRYEIVQQTDLTVDAGDAGSFTTTTQQTLDVVWEFSSIADDGSATGVQKIERLRLLITMPDGLELKYDSADDEPPQGVAAMLGPMYQALLENEIPIEVATNGKLRKFAPPAEMTERLAYIPATRAMGDLVTGAGLRAIGENIAFRLPKGKLSQASRTERSLVIENRVLGRMSGELIWNFYGQLTENSDIERFAPKIVLDIEPAPAVEDDVPPQPEPLVVPKIETQKATGDAHFNRATGRLDHSSLRIEVDLTGETTGAVVKSHIDQVTNVRYKPE